MEHLFYGSILYPLLIVIWLLFRVIKYIIIQANDAFQIQKTDQLYKIQENQIVKYTRFISQCLNMCFLIGIIYALRSKFYSSDDGSHVFMSFFAFIGLILTVIPIYYAYPRKRKIVFDTKNQMILVDNSKYMSFEETEVIEIYTNNDMWAGRREFAYQDLVIKSKHKTLKIGVSQDDKFLEKQAKMIQEKIFHEQIKYSKY